jgi:hypothetical protein
MGDDDLGVLVDDAEKRGRRGADALDLLLGRVSEGVTPERYDDVSENMLVHIYIYISNIKS